MTIILSSISPIGMQIDSLEQGGSLSQMSEAERTRHVDVLRAMQRAYDDAEKVATAAAASKELTALGRREAVKRAVTGAKAAMHPHEAVAQRFASVASETRAKAVQAPTSERTVETLMLEREIRDRLAGKDPLDVNANVYVPAVERGDWRTVAAIENAPPSFPLITPEQREIADMMKLRRSPLADQVIEADRLAYIYRATSGAVHAELDTLAKRFGVELSDVEG